MAVSGKHSTTKTGRSGRFEELRRELLAAQHMLQSASLETLKSFGTHPGKGDEWLIAQAELPRQALRTRSWPLSPAFLQMKLEDYGLNECCKTMLSLSPFLLIARSC